MDELRRLGWAVENLGFLVWAWPFLVELKVPGSRQRWTYRGLRLVERSDGEVEGGLDSSTVPVDLAVLDLLRRMTSVADELVGALVEVLDGVDVPGGPELVAELRGLGSSWVDPRPHFQVASRALSRSDEVDARTLPWVLGQVEPLAAAGRSMLGEFWHGQVLDAWCPWCRGRTGKAPVGGERTLVLRNPGEDGGLDEALIVCMGVECCPPASACGNHDGRGHPAWPYREWDWLANQLLDHAPALEGAAS